MSTGPEGDFAYTIQERFVLCDGTHVVRHRCAMGQPLRAGDLMLTFMEPLADEIAEARQMDRPLCVHGTEQGRRGQYVLPVSSIAYARVEMLGPDGEQIAPEPGFSDVLAEADDEQDGDGDDDPLPFAGMVKNNPGLS